MRSEQFVIYTMARIINRNSKRNFAGEPRLPWGPGDWLRLLLKLRILGPIKPLVNFHKCE
jgi:hypothetical protein